MYTIAEVESRSNNKECWSIINYKVYDLTSYINKHPGGAILIQKICGKDATTMFDKKHGNKPVPVKVLDKYLIGELKQ